MLRFWAVHISPVLVISNKLFLLAIAMISFVAGVSVLQSQSNPLDRWFHDRLSVQNQRVEWKDTALVVLDERVPFSLGRDESLTLYALAMERLIEMGASTVFLDAHISLKNYRKTNFAQCVTSIGTLKRCSLTGSNSRCLSHKGVARSAPLALDANAFDYLSIPMPLSEYAPPPLFNLFGRSSAVQNLTSRWTDVSLPESPDGVLRESYAIAPNELDFGAVLLDPTLTPSCIEESDRSCYRVRFSSPILEFGDTQRPVIPVSQLASCDDSWKQWENRVADRHIMLQVTGLKETVDVHITPATTHTSGYPLTSGTHWLLDAVETKLQGDGYMPLSLSQSITFLALLSVLATLLHNFMRMRVSLFIVVSILATLFTIHPLVNPSALLPYTSLIVVILVPLLLLSLTRMAMGERRARMVSRFVPPQVRGLLLSQSGGHAIDDRQVLATVLMSDVQGFTDITSLLDEPKQVLHLMNVYLDEVTTGLQEKHDAWLEAYIADLVCFYWPKITDESEVNDLRLKAVSAMVDLYQNQKRFFGEIEHHLQDKVTDDQLQKIKSKIGAGIALTQGDVIMGELGPEKGIRKFGVLGDPLNLASRMEGLSRFFNAHMLVTSDFIEACKEMALPVRRLVNVQVKGKTEPVTIYAVGLRDDPVYSADNCYQWETWLAQFEANNVLPEGELSGWMQDVATYREWSDKGFWDSKRKCFSLSFK